MFIIEELKKLTSKNEIREEDKIKIWEAVQCFSQYVDLIVKKNIESSVYSLTDKENEVEIGRKYERCILEIKFINNLSEKLLGEKIYKKDFNKIDVEEFLLEVNNEIFKNRKISRR